MLSYTDDENKVIQYNLPGEQFGNIQLKPKRDSFDPAVSLLGINLNEIARQIHRNMFTRMFIQVLSVSNKKLEAT